MARRGPVCSDVRAVRQLPRPAEFAKLRQRTLLESIVPHSPRVPILLLAALLTTACSSTSGGGGGSFFAKDASGDGIALKLDTLGNKDGVLSDATDSAVDGTDSDVGATTEDGQIGSDALFDPDAPDFGGFFDDDGTTTADTGGNLDNCTAGTQVCQGATSVICDGAGGVSSSTVCPDTCAPALGCVLCIPGSTTCDGNGAKKCSDDGSAWLDSSCDAELGLSCDLTLGKCVGPCANTTLERSYIGCEYYPTVTSNGQLYNGFDFAVAIANASKDSADIVIYQGTKLIATQKVAPGSVVAV